MTAQRQGRWCTRIIRCCVRRAVCWCRSRCRPSHSLWRGGRWTLVADSLRTRLSRGTRVMGESEVVQQQLGEAAAEIETAILIMHARREETLALVDVRRGHPAGGRAAEPARYRFRGLAGRGAASSGLVELAGARTVYDADPLQSLWRDLVTISTHTAVSRHLGDGAVRQAAARPAAGGG